MNPSQEERGSSTRNPNDHGSWGHFDHGTSFVPYRCLQSIVVMEDCTDAERDGGLVVWDKSHRAHDGYFRVKGIECKDNWYRFPHEAGDKNKPQPELKQMEEDGRPYLSPGDPDYGSERPVPTPRALIGAEAGDVIVWFSDTAHQNQPLRVDGKNRIVAYVSMAPRQYLLPRELGPRVRAFHDRATSSHWAACGFKRNAVPRTYTTEAHNLFKERYKAHLASLPQVELTDAVGSLMGLGDHVDALSVKKNSSSRGKRPRSPRRATTAFSRSVML